MTLFSKFAWIYSLTELCMCREVMRQCNGKFYNWRWFLHKIYFLFKFFKINENGEKKNRKDYGIDILAYQHIFKIIFMQNEKCWREHLHKHYTCTVMSYYVACIESQQSVKKTIHISAIALFYTHTKNAFGFSFLFHSYSSQFSLIF